MKVHILFPADSTDQMWVAKNGKRIENFGSLEGVKAFFGKRYINTSVAWEEGEPSGKEWVQGLNGYRVSTLMYFGPVAHYGGRHFAGKWQDTGWRVWREQ